MAYVKHPIHGNKHVADSEVPALVKDGWVKWPRTEDEKALGDGSDAAYWRKRYERDMAANAQEGAFFARDPDGNPPSIEPPAGATIVRRGRPPKA